MASESQASEAEKQPISRQEALEAYLALGPGRSFAKLLNVYQTYTGIRVPALATVKKWSQKEGWAERAAEYDALVAARTCEKSIENVSEQRALTSDALIVAARQMLDKSTSLLEDLSGDDALKAIEVLTSQLVALSQHARVLSGGVSDRTAGVFTGVCVDADERAAALARLKEVTARQPDQSPVGESQ